MAKPTIAGKEATESEQIGGLTIGYLQVGSIWVAKAQSRWYETEYPVSGVADTKEEALRRLNSGLQLLRDELNNYMRRELPQLPPEDSDFYRCVR